MWQPLDEHLEVFGVDANGTVNDLWKASDGPWQPVASLSGPGLVRKGTAISGVWQPTDEHLEVFSVDEKLALQDVWKAHDSDWQPPLALTRSDYRPVVFIDPRAPTCTHDFQIWRTGIDLDAATFNMCADFLGVSTWCAGQGPGYYLAGTTSTPRVLTCRPPNNGDSDPVHDSQVVAVGVENGVITAMPYVSDSVQAITCLTGALFACATLALSLAGQAQLAGAAQDAVDVAGKVSDCANGDIVACAEVGTQGANDAATAVGVPIPGADALSAGLQCANDGDFDACVQLGQMAAGAAGLPAGDLTKAVANINSCSGGDATACIALGQQAAQAGVPIGGIANGAANLQQCGQGDVLACRQLGSELVSATK